MVTQYILLAIIFCQAVESSRLLSKFPSPPSSEGTKCFIYYDEAILGPVGIFKAPYRPGNQWLDLQYKHQTCEQRVKWYRHAAWNTGLKNNGNVYPGSALEKVRDDAYVIKQLQKFPSKETPPPSEGTKCFIYYDEANLGPVKLFQGGRPGNLWFDGQFKDQTCEQRANWWQGQAWHQGLKNKGNAYPGSALEKVRDDAYVIKRKLPGYTRTEGNCRGGGKYPGLNTLWNCIRTGTITNVQCAQLCNSDVNCKAYDRPIAAQGHCCLFSAGHTGNGKNAGRECYVSND
jgi:hypothetical protein